MALSLTQSFTTCLLSCAAFTMAEAAETTYEKDWSISPLPYFALSDYEKKLQRQSEQYHAFNIMLQDNVPAQNTKIMALQLNPPVKPNKQITALQLNPPVKPNPNITTLQLNPPMKPNPVITEWQLHPPVKPNPHIMGLQLRK